MTSGPVGMLLAGLQVKGGVPVGGVTEGIRKPPPAPPNWLLLMFNRATTTGSSWVMPGGRPQGKKVLVSVAASRMAGSTGIDVLMNVPGESPLRWRVPW